MKFSAALSALFVSQVSAFSLSVGGIEKSSALFARKPFISGNWKLNPQTRDEAIELGSSIAEAVTADTPDIDIALFVPYVFIEATHTAVGEKVLVGAEVSNEIAIDEALEIYLFISLYFY